MSFADAEFLPSGTYAIINVEYNRCISFNNQISASSDEYGWTISYLPNEKWSIQGSPCLFAGIAADAKEGEDVASEKNPPNPHQWVIEHYSGETQFYTIHSPSQPKLFWSLPNGNDGTSLQLSPDPNIGPSLWKFKNLEKLAGDPEPPSDPMKQFVAAPVQRPTQLDSAIKNTFAMTIPAGWLTTITSVSCGNCVNLIRVRRVVNGALEKDDLISGWDAIDKAMIVDGSDSDSLALPSTDDAYVLVIEAFNSSDRARRDPRGLPGFKDLSTSLRFITTSRPSDLKSFPDFQTFMIFDESLDLSSPDQGRTQNAIITIHASLENIVDTGAVGSNFTPENLQNSVLHATHPSVCTKVTSSSGLQFVHYRVYNKEGAIVTKRPAYLDDTYLGRVRSKWVTPPHNAGSLRHCLASMESIDPTATTLFATLSSKSALVDDIPVFFKDNQTLGMAPDEPVVLFSEAKPGDGLKSGTERLHVSSDAQSPLTPRFLYYGVYSEGGASASNAPVDPEEVWVSRVDLILIPPPLSVASLKRFISAKENITGASQLFADNVDVMTPLIDDHILTENEKWPGSTPDNHVVFKLTAQHPLPKFSDGSQYMILNCSTGKALVLLSGYSPGRDLYLYDLPAYLKRNPLFFFLKAQDDGGIALRSVNSGKWAGPNFCAHPTAYSYYFTPTENKDWFFIHPDKTSRSAFYDTQVRLGWPWDFQLGVKDLNANDPLQMWRLVPAY